jgi:inner membrane protein
MSETNIQLIWLISGCVLMVSELVLPGGIVFFLGLGAVCVSALLHFEFIHGILQAFTTWFVGSLALLIGLRGVIQKLLPAETSKGNTEEDLDAYDCIVDVVEDIPANREGRINFRGTSWTAKNYHKDQVISAGEKVRIIFRDNLAWIVEKAAEPKE